MTDNSSSQEGQVSSNESSIKISTKSRNDLKWDTLKDEIHQIYLEQNNTLTETMRVIEEKRKFKASLRTWKTKLKEWNFEKNLPVSDLVTILAKKRKRLQEQEKETAFSHNGREIQLGRLENYRKRIPSKRTQAMSPSAVTPDNITYRTPSPEAPSPHSVLFRGDVRVSRDGVLISHATELHEGGGEIYHRDPDLDSFVCLALASEWPLQERITHSQPTLRGMLEGSVVSRSMPLLPTTPVPVGTLDFEKSILDFEVEEKIDAGGDVDGSNQVMESSISALVRSGMSGIASGISWTSSMGSKYGLTYSDVSLSGISFNYSGLFPKRSKEGAKS